MAVMSIESKNALPICNSNALAHMVLTRFGIFELTPERVVVGVPAKYFRTGWKLFHMKEHLLFSKSVAVPVSKSYSSKVMSMGTISC